VPIQHLSNILGRPGRVSCELDLLIANRRQPGERPFRVSTEVIADGVELDPDGAKTVFREPEMPAGECSDAGMQETSAVGQ
jgi:hypothetical protein